MGKFGEYIKSAIKQIVGNGYRTLMTMLGIVIGIAAVSSSWKWNEQLCSEPDQ